MKLTDEQVNHESAASLPENVVGDSAPYTIDVNGTSVRLHFIGSVGLNTRLAGAFGNMLKPLE